MQLPKMSMSVSIPRLSLDEIKRGTRTIHPVAFLGLFLVLLGVAAAITFLIVGIKVSQDVADWYVLPKATRDAAGAGSETLSTLRGVNVTEAWLVPLGVGLTTGFIFSGILLIFAIGIIDKLRLRAAAMHELLPKIREKRQAARVTTT